jgi:hypothetical protein
MSPLALWVDQFRGATKMVGIGLALVLAALAGGWLNGVFKAREIAALETALQTVKREHAEQWRLLAERAAADLQAAQARGDVLTEELMAASRAAELLRGELHEQINLATQGRACLDAAALRVLDRAPGIAARPVPAAPRRAAAAGGAGAAADPPQHAGGAHPEPDARSASDTDIARWALSAGARYDECARRLDALIDWHDKPPDAERAPAWN